jgi:hypothetical protein
MAIKSVQWDDNGAQDLHLIPGHIGPRLDHLLRAFQTAGPSVRADALPAPATVAFTANFAAGPATAGIAFNPANGEVTVNGPLPAGARLLDFVVTGTVTEGANTFSVNRRVRIHGSITRMWLTPETLTVHQNAGYTRPTVLAEFDDGTYGDLTPWCPSFSPAAADRTYVRRVGTDTPAIVWSTTNAAVVDVDHDTGRLIGKAAAGAAVGISADRPPLPAPANASATGNALPAPPWADPVRLTRIGGPGFAAMGTVPNVLILPDGFAAADRAAYEKIARHLVQRLGVRRRTHPYRLLKDRMNYFMAWVPSREAGISTREDVVRFHVAGAMADAVELDTSVAAAGLPAEWHVAAPGAPAANTRFLVNERDTAFAMILGERPKLDRFNQQRETLMNPLRLAEDDFDDFLRNLRNNADVAVGAVWARGGKDEQKLLILCRSNRDGGSNAYRLGSGRLIGMTLDAQDRLHIRDNPGGRGKDVIPDPIPGIAQIEIWTTAAHELAHSFTLEDEYGGGGKLPASRLNDVAQASNLMSRASLLVGGNLAADKAKWRWPRVRRAGVLAAQPVPLGGNRYHVTLAAGHGAPFVVGDVVRFRVRPLPPAPGHSDRFIVTAKGVDQLDVEALTAAAFAPAGFAAGSVLIRPARANDPDVPNRVFGNDLELMHVTVRARIDATHNPLNAAFGAAANRPCPGVPLLTPTPATNFPGGHAPKPPMFSSWIVGLYENGLSYDCDVYRPTGVCLMRAQHFRDAPSKTESAYQFCPVCRYVLVDAVDPSKHGAIDDEYAPRYPR